MKNKKPTAKEVKAAIAELDGKYFNKITGLVTAYITDYLRRMHPEMTQGEIDDKVNLHANGWNAALTRNILAIEGLPENSLDNGAFID